MKQIIPFNKEIVFKTMISKVTSISLEHTLSLQDESTISGDFIVSGSYKMTEASQIDEDFCYKVPVEIEIDNKYDTSNLDLEIDDFTYEVIDEEKLLLNIALCIDGLELKVADEKELDSSDDLTSEIETVETLFNDESSLDSSILEKERKNEIKEDLFLELSKNIDLQIPSSSSLKEDLETVQSIDLSAFDTKDNSAKKESDAPSIFSAFKNTEETFATYSVYIMRDGDNLDTVVNKYKTTREDLSLYNDLSDIRVGSKIIIPTTSQ